MKRLATNILLMGVLAGLLCAAAPADAATTATVNVSITVMPYAEVRMDRTSVEIAIPAGVTYYGPVYVGGTVVCNCETMLFALITKPDGAPGNWVTYPVSATKQPSQGHDPHLIGITVLLIPAGFTGWTGTLNVSGKSVQNPGQIGTPAAGEVVLTVVPG
ncbi:MAG: hypothetical protein NT031_01315 [Planctomycetota bacterium]|nr:hypothetical protein [Planctomycetota bacterium]